jgi:hypothetical protein
MEPWHSIDAQEYPYRHDVVEFLYQATGGRHWFGKWLDIAPHSDVTGLLWRAVPVNWPTSQHPAS